MDEYKARMFFSENDFPEKTNSKESYFGVLACMLPSILPTEEVRLQGNENGALALDPFQAA